MFCENNIIQNKKRCLIFHFFQEMCFFHLFWWKQHFCCFFHLFCCVFHLFWWKKHNSERIKCLIFSEMSHFFPNVSFFVNCPKRTYSKNVYYPFTMSLNDCSLRSREADHKRITTICFFVQFTKNETFRKKWDISEKMRHLILKMSILHLRWFWMTAP